MYNMALNKNSYSLSALVIALVLAIVSFQIFSLIYKEQNTPYIDEIFHVRQAQLYCSNNWLEWNPKITTLPGLYVTSYIIVKPLQYLSPGGFCSLYTLRLTNLVATLLNFLFAYRILCQQEKKLNVKSPDYLKLVSALNIAIFPPLYFFTFLYYTDVWSTTFVLLMYNFHLSQGKFNKFLGTLSACMAVMMRQTNILWVGLLLIDKSWEILTKNMKTNSFQDYKYTMKVIQIKFIDVITSKPGNYKSFFHLFINIFTQSYHYISVCVFFIIFVIFNGSIVVGDKSAHVPTIHAMQNMYFLDFAAFFALPFAFLELLSIIKNPPNAFVMIFLTGLCAALSEINKLEHPYLLADNRHFAFYIWKRLFGHSFYRRLLVPTYVCCGIFFYRLLRSRCHFIFVVALSVCIIINLTPQHLFELRYFLIPFIIWRLQFKQHPIVFVETAFFVILNALVVYLFLNKTFVWPSEPGAKQRFIW